MQRNAIFLDGQNILHGFSPPPAEEIIFRIFGNLPATRKILSGSSEIFLPPEKYFPDLRKPSCRRENTFRIFGNLLAAKKSFSG